MKRTIVLCIILAIASAAQSNAHDAAPRNAEPKSDPTDAVEQVTALVLGDMALQIEAVGREIGAASGYSREELLTMYGRSAAASGRFEAAATAYAMFLNEFGTEHPNSENIAVRLAECLFPFKYDSVDVVHTPFGPRLVATWRMRYTPQRGHLRAAISAFELAASLAQDQYEKGAALLKLGWVHRVLGDWDASTVAWDRCTQDAVATKPAADALWLAAENLEWTNRPAEAAERMSRFLKDYPGDRRVLAGARRRESLESQARRGAEWLSDPVAALQSEIEDRQPDRSPQEVYRSIAQWLQRRGERDDLTQVSRWACEQSDWPASGRTTACFDLADALDARGDSSAQEESVRRLREITEFTSSESAAATAAIRCAQLLRTLDRSEEADSVLEQIAAKVKGSQRWEPVVLSEYADSLLERGDGTRALSTLKKLMAAHPDYDVTERMAAATKAARKEGE